MDSERISALFLDIGGVLLTNGWDRTSRVRAAREFGLDYEEMDERHHLTFDAFEEGKLSLDEYLTRVVFYRERPFTPAEFQEFMFFQSRPKLEMFDLTRRLKKRHGLKVAAVSNAGREVTVHRIREFNLDSFVDFFVSSCFVHIRKPDKDIYRMALDCAHVPPDRVIYIDDRALFVEVAKGLGIRGIYHEGYESTRMKLDLLGLPV